MSINKIGNMGAKAALSPEQEAQALSLIEEFKERIDKLSGDYVQYLSAEEQAEIEKWKAGAELWITKLTTALETGVWPGGGDIPDEYDFYDTLPELDSGTAGMWHGDISFATDAENVSVYEEKLKIYTDMINDSTFEDVISVTKAPNTNPEGGSLNDSAIGFVLNDNVSKVVGKTIGNDIWVTVYYRDDSTAKTWCLEGLAGRDDVQIYFYGGQCTKDIILDMSQVIRVASSTVNGNKFGSTENGIKLFGGSGNDILIGSGSNDLLVGGAGNDRLLGMGGWDILNGDGYYLDPQYSTEAGGVGDDYLDGGTGFDTINGGPGAMDTYVMDPEWGDENPGETEYNDVVRQFGSTEEAQELANFITQNSTGWTASATMDEETGEILVERNADENNSITIRPPENCGYTICNARSDGNDIVVTMIKMVDEDGDGTKETPVYLTVRIKGIGKKENATNIQYKTPTTSNPHDITITDWSGVESGGNMITFAGQGSADSVIAPKTNIDSLHINAEELDEGSTLTKEQMEELLGEKADQDGDGVENYGWGLSGDDWASGEVKEDGITLTPDGPVDIDFNIPEDFNFDVDGAFYEDVGNNRIIYIIDVTNEETGAFELIKVTIMGGANPDFCKSLKVNGNDVQPMGRISFDMTSGYDLMVGSIGSTKEWKNNEDDTVFKGYYDTEFTDNDVDQTKDSDDDGFPDVVEEIMGTDPQSAESVPGKEEEEPADGGEEENP